MDIIEVFLKSHASLRGELSALIKPFERPHGVGWDDCVSLDQKSLFRDILSCISSIKAHEEAEEEFLKEVSDALKPDEQVGAALAEGRRSLRELMKLLSVVAFSCDGEHVHRVRELLFRLRDELEPHLAYEEKILFPLLRERLPARQLSEAGRAVGGSQKR